MLLVILSFLLQRYNYYFKNTSLIWFFFSFIRIFELSLDEKKNKFSFCISLIYSYLCSQNYQPNMIKTGDMKRFFLCVAMMICQLLLTAEAQAINYKEKDTTAARLSIEFRRLYIDGDEKKLEKLSKADIGMLTDEELTEGIKLATKLENYQLAIRFRDELKGRKDGE